jgi:hypothetical protein
VSPPEDERKIRPSKHGIILRCQYTEFSEQDKIINRTAELEEDAVYETENRRPVEYKTLIRLIIRLGLLIIKVVEV